MTNIVGRTKSEQINFDKKQEKDGSLWGAWDFMYLFCYGENIDKNVSGAIFRGIKLL